MKSKIRTIIILITCGISTNAYSEDIAYTLSLKYINEKKQIESVIVDKDNRQYILVSDIVELYGKKLDLQTKTFNKEEFYLLDDVGTLESDEAKIYGKLTLKPKFLPDQNYSLIQGRFNGEAKPQSGYHLDYDFLHNTSQNNTSLYINNGFSTSSGNFGDLSFNFNKTYGTTLGEANFNIRDRDNKNIYRLGTGITRMNEQNNGYRFFGIQLQSNYDLEKTKNDKVSASFNGTAELDGVAELYMNGNKMLSKNIRPGDFSFDGLYNPMTTTGEAQLLIKDINGNIQTISKPLIGSPRNLKKGFKDYSFDFGLLRESYNEFGPLFTTGNYYYGLTDRITLNGNYDASKSAQHIGGSATLSTDLGTFKLGGSFGDGKSYNAGYYLNIKDLNINTEYIKYFDYKTIDNHIKTEANDKLVLSARYRLTEKNTLNLNYVKIGDQERTSIGTSYRINNNMSLSGTVTKNEDNKYSAFIGFEYKFGGGSSNSRYDSKNERFNTTIRSDSNELDKFNYMASYDSDPHSQSINTKVGYSTQFGDLSASVYKNKDGFSGSVNAKGSVVYNEGSLILSKKINDSYIVVDSKEPNISINTNTGKKGNTSKSGLMAYPVPALSEQKFFINSEEYEDDITPKETNFSVTAFYKSPTKVNIEIKKPGFYIELDSTFKTIKINNTEYFKTDKGYFIDELEDGEYNFNLDGKTYTFDTKNIIEGKIIPETNI